MTCPDPLDKIVKSGSLTASDQTVPLYLWLDKVWQWWNSTVTRWQTLVAPASCSGKSVSNPMLLYFIFTASQAVSRRFHTPSTPTVITYLIPRRLFLFLIECLHDGHNLTVTKSLQSFPVTRINGI